MTSRPLKAAARQVHHSAMKGSTAPRRRRKLHEVVVGARLEEAAHAVEHFLGEEGAHRLDRAARAGERARRGLGRGAHLGVHRQADAHLGKETDANRFGSSASRPRRNRALRAAGT